MATKQFDANQFINDALAADGTRDTVIIGLVTEGDMSLNKATKLYGDYAKANGLTSGVVSHKADALEWLGLNYPEFTDAAQVKSAVIELQAEFDVAESTARDYVKAYAKQMGVDLPIEDPREAMFQWFVNRIQGGQDIDKADFIEYACEKLGRSKSNANEYWKGYELHLALVAATK